MRVNVYSLPKLLLSSHFDDLNKNTHMEEIHVKSIKGKMSKISSFFTHKFSVRSSKWKTIKCLMYKHNKYHIGTLLASVYFILHKTNI